MGKKRFAIIGAGAAGFFAAINAKENNRNLDVVLFESAREGLKKVRISGGGRCNVTHSCFDVKELVKRYPRGSKELLGPFYQFQPRDTIEWFGQKEVHLKTEEDGRMFPVTDNSETIINCFLDSAKSLGVEIRYQTKILKLEKKDTNYEILCTQNEEEYSESFDFVMIATGSNPSGIALAKNLGHTIIEQLPSLFTFNVDDEELNDLQGVSVPGVEIEIQLKDKKMNETGPLLFVHWGLSGPAVLKLSAFAARELYELDYQTKVWIKFISSEQKVRDIIEQQRIKQARSKVVNQPGVELPSRLVRLLLVRAGVGLDCKWSELTKKMANELVRVLTRFELDVSGKSTFKEEFVTCGGVDLKEIDFKSMQSKLNPGLYFAGEVLNIDGITGGYNFQNAWTGAWIAAQSVANS